MDDDRQKFLDKTCREADDTKLQLLFESQSPMGDMRQAALKEIIRRKRQKEYLMLGLTVLIAILTLILVIKDCHIL